MNFFKFFFHQTVKNQIPQDRIEGISEKFTEIQENSKKKIFENCSLAPTTVHEYMIVIHRSKAYSLSFQNMYLKNAYAHAFRKKWIKFDF